MKKSSGKKAAKKSIKRGAIVDGIAVNEMTKEQLEGHIHRLQLEIEKEREERNYFQVERDKISSFWDVTKAHLEEKQSELILKDKRLEEVDLLHLSEIKVYKQKMKHIMLEYQNHINSRTKQEMTTLQIAEDEHHQREALLLQEKEELKIKIIQLKKEYNGIIKDIKMKHSQEIKEIRKEFESKLEITQHELKLQFEIIRDELEQSRRKEIREVEEAKNLHIENIIKTHDKTLADIKNYYNDVMQNNLSLIDAMKDQVSTSTKKEQKMRKQAQFTSRQNEELIKEILETREELTKLELKTKRYEKEKIHYAKAKSNLKRFNNEIKQLKWENDALSQQFEKVEKNRDALHSKFQTTIQEIKEKTRLKNLILEEKVASLNLDHRRRDYVVNSEPSCSTNQPPPLSEFVQRSLEEASDSHKLEKEHWPLKSLDKSNLIIKGERAVQSAKPHCRQEKHAISPS